MALMCAEMRDAARSARIRALNAAGGRVYISAFITRFSRESRNAHASMEAEDEKAPRGRPSQDYEESGVLPWGG